MLTPTLDKLRQLKFYGMLNALEEQLRQTNYDELSFEERLSLLIDRETTERENRRLQTRLTKAKLKHQACFENIDFKSSRGIDRSVLLSLSSCKWVKDHNNVLLVGPTGTGKTFLACALAHKACLEGYSAYYVRLPRLFQELLIAKGDGRYTKLMSQFAKIDLLILDDFGINKLNDEQQRNLLEIVDDRHGLRSTIVTSQFPITHWHENLGDPTLADAILDRLIHNAYKIQLEGESMRKKMNNIDKNNEINENDLTNLQEKA